MLEALQSPAKPAPLVYANIGRNDLHKPRGFNILVRLL